MKHLAITVFVIVLFSCSSEEINIDYDTFIMGVIDDQVEVFPQRDLSGVNTSNTYFANYEETWLQAYGEDHDQENQLWTVRISDVDILNVPLPYSDWQNATASVSWDNQLTNNDSRCGGVDAGCIFSGATNRGLNFVITDVKDGVITGTFSGRLSLQGTGFGPFRDESVFVDVTEGAYKIAFRIDDSQ